LLGPPCTWCAHPATAVIAVKRRNRLALSVPACDHHRHLARAAPPPPSTAARVVEQVELFEVGESRFIGDAIAGDE
jgi:hypothetical protein